MANQQSGIQELNEKLNLLLKKQKNFAQEIQNLNIEIQQLIKTNETPGLAPKKTQESVTETIPIQHVSTRENISAKDDQKLASQVPGSYKKTTDSKIRLPKRKSNLEKFIGENLINKIGIAILVIGVIIGAKYSIENNLISPLTRIILGYFTGLGLLGFGIKLKTKYKSYSAVLVSGSLAILYFITYAAYDLYSLFPQLIAFALMLVFTVFGVVAALNYNKQVIAHIGLVGAYAVPFLLSNNSGNVITLFSYIVIINVGILIIAFKKYWKPLYYAAFIFTWLIYASFSVFNYEAEKHFQIGLVFLCIFFAQFYGIFLAYKLKANEEFKKSDVVLLLLNSFIFFGFGYSILTNHEIGNQLLGVFTLVNAVVHFAVSAIVFKKKLADRNLFYLISGLVLMFITIAIPVQLNGNWVTLLWAIEAALLFWIGRTKNVLVYEKLSYPLMILALFSLFQDWNINYKAAYLDEHMTSLLNVTFLTSIIFVAAFGFIHWVNGKENSSSNNQNKSKVTRMMTRGIPVILLLALFGAFYLEIEYYWGKLFWSSGISTPIESEYAYAKYNYNLKYFGNIWLLNYTLFFIATLAFLNIKKITSQVFGIIILGIGGLVTILFLTFGLYALSELRQNYILQDISDPFKISTYNIAIRYVAFGFYALFIVALYQLSKVAFMSKKIKIPFKLLMHVSILWILSSELLHWMDLAGSDQTYKLGLSILWGVYSLFLIILGIFKEKKHLRIGAISLFGATLLKLFFYDIAAMNTITKTVVFVSLGVLLLTISFLYNKYKHKITDEQYEE